ncbi:MAG: RNA polymerase sigma factor [Xanthomonadales bacterium]|nr:RNA polymerase sigma factor [Xanthomonadales bacterium]
MALSADPTELPEEPVDPERAAELRALAERIARGDRVAEERLFAQTRFALWMILRRRGCGSEEADDLVQETLMVVLRRLRDGSLEQPERLDGFLYVTALNLRRSQQRKQHRRPVQALEDTPEVMMQASTDPFSQLGDFQRRSLLRDVLAELPQARDREVLQRHYLDEQDKASTCAEMDLLPAHYDRVLHRARQRLRKLLDRWLE